MVGWDNIPQLLEREVFYDILQLSLDRVTQSLIQVSGKSGIFQNQFF